MSDIRFTILGSSSGVPQPNRVTSGYVLRTGAGLTLFDCGGGVTSSFLRQGFDFTDVSRIIISHTHPDHVCDLPLFLQGLYLAGRSGPVIVYLPEEFVAAFRSYLTAVYLFPERFPYQLELTGYSGELEIPGECKTQAFSNSHLQKYRTFVENASAANKMQSHSFILRTADRSLLYSADIGSLNDIAEYVKGRDYVLMEASHIDVADFLRMAPGYNVGQFVITHLDGEEEAATILDRAERAGVSNLTIAAEGMTFEL